MTPEQVRAHMVEYLYGELTEARRREFEAALATSESYRRELAALERTLGLARAALSRELSEDPPAAVRTRVLAAAHEASRLQGAPAAAPVRTAQSQEKRGFRALLRAPWLYPAVGFAAALAIVIVIDRRERASEVGPQPYDQAPAATPSRDDPAPEQKAEEQERPEAPYDRGLGAGSSDGLSPDPKRRAGGAQSSSGRERAAPEEPASAATDRAAKPAAPARERKYAAPPPPVARAERSFESASEAEPFPGSARDDEEESSAKGSAAAEGARATPSVPATRPSADRLAGGARRTREPRATSAAQPSQAPAAAAPASEGTQDFAAAPSKAVLAESEPLARRAAEQLRDGLFAEAVKSHRELLRRFPTDARVAEWRRSLALALRALRADGGEPR